MEIRKISIAEELLFRNLQSYCFEIQPDNDLPPVEFNNTLGMFDKDNLFKESFYASFGYFQVMHIVFINLKLNDKR